MSAETVCRDTCDLYRASTTATWSGQPTKTFSTTATYSGVQCRKVSELDMNAFTNREGVIATAQFYFPIDSDVLESDEILHNARRYSIMAVDTDPGSAGRIKLAYVKEIRA